MPLVLEQEKTYNFYTSTTLFSYLEQEINVINTDTPLI